jgi:hypothetical protein
VDGSDGFYEIGTTTRQPVKLYGHRQRPEQNDHIHKASGGIALPSGVLSNY